MVTFAMFMAKLRSLMYIRKRIGSNTDPRGTPLVMVNIFQLKPLIDADCFHSVKYDSNNLFDIIFTL